KFVRACRHLWFLSCLYLQSCRKTKGPPVGFSEGGLLKLVLNPSCSFAVAPEKSVDRHTTRFLDDWQHENSNVKSAELGLSSFDCSDPRPIQKGMPGIAQESKKTGGESGIRTHDTR